MCRWLLYMRDLAGSDDLSLTQEFLAQMLGVRRPSVSLGRQHPAKEGFDQIQARPYAIARPQRITKGRLRVLRHGQVALRAVAFGLAINLQKLIMSGTLHKVYRSPDKRPKDAGMFQPAPHRKACS
jgi:hypothetical protein